MSQRMDNVQNPIIPQVGAWIRDTMGTISLGQGVVHYPPPSEVNEKLPLFWADPHGQKYSSVRGMPSLITQIYEKLDRDNGIKVNNHQAVLVTAGANMGFLNALFSITDPGDEVILFSPYYFNHEMAITMLGCKPVCVDLDELNQIDLDKLRGHITHRTRAIVTISPNNPTGAIYTRDTLVAINKLCAQHGCYHISDEAYEYFMFDGLKHFSPGSIDGADSHTISIFSLSKSYGFAGWRIGYMVIPEHLSQAVEKVQDTNLICPTIASQYAAMGALEAGAAYPSRFLSELQEVRDLIADHLMSLGDLCKFAIPQGAFYFFVKVDLRISSLELVERLIKFHRVALIPGSAFGKDDGCYLRIAFGALDKSTVAEGVGRLVKGLRAIAA